MLVQNGINRYQSKSDRWYEECFRDEGRTLKLIPPYSRTFWDWLLGRHRVPQVVAEDMLEDGVVDQYVPVPSLGICLVTCSKKVWCLYMFR